MLELLRITGAPYVVEQENAGLFPEQLAQHALALRDGCEGGVATEAGGEFHQTGEGPPA